MPLRSERGYRPGKLPASELRAKDQVSKESLEGWESGLIHPARNRTAGKTGAHVRIMHPPPDMNIVRRKHKDMKHFLERQRIIKRKYRKFKEPK